MPDLQFETNAYAKSINSRQITCQADFLAKKTSFYFLNFQSQRLNYA